MLGPGGILLLLLVTNAMTGFAVHKFKERNKE